MYIYIYTCMCVRVYIHYMYISCLNVVSLRLIMQTHIFSIDLLPNIYCYSSQTCMIKPPYKLKTDQARVAVLTEKTHKKYAEIHRW